MSSSNSQRLGRVGPRVLVALFAVAVGLGLAACGSSSSGGGSSNESVSLPWGKFTLNDQTAQKIQNGDKPTIKLVSINTSAPFWGPMRDGVAAAGKQYNVDASFTGPPDYSIEQQVAQIDELTTQGVDGLAIAVGDADTLTPAIDRVTAAGIPVFTVNVDAPESHRFAYVGQDNRRSGTIAGKEFLKEFYKNNKKGGGPYKVILTATDVAGQYARDRFDGFKEVVDKTGDFEYTDPTTTGPDPAKVYSTVEDLFRANSDAKGLYMADETIVQGGTYIQRNGLSDSVVAVGHNFAPGTAELMKSGAIDASVGQLPYKQGHDVIQYLAQFLKDGKLPACKPICDVGQEVADQDNVDQFDFGSTG